jgi:hypothetical protein
VGGANVTSHSPHSRHSFSTMNRLLIFVGMTVGGYGGWWVGGYFNLELMATFLISTVGSAVGVYVAWRVKRDFLDG